MAKFVKDDVVKGESPSYLQYARKGDVPPPVQDKTWEHLGNMLGTVGTLLEQTDKSIKNQIDETIFKRVTAAQDQEITHLEQQVGNNTSDIRTTEGNAQTQGQDPTSYVNTTVWGPTVNKQDGNAAIVPPEHIAANIDRGIARVERFNTAATQGKEPSHYSNRALAEWRGIRKDVPAQYRMYADKKMAATLGFDPANKYIAELQGQLKSLQDTKKDERNKVLSQIDNLKDKAPEAMLLYNDVMQGRVNNEEALRRVDRMYKPIVEKSMAETRWSTVQANDNMANWTANDTIDKIIAAKQTNFANAAIDHFGLNLSPNDIRQKLIAIQTGKDKAGQEELTRYGQAMNAHADRYRMELESEMDRANSNGMSFRGTLGSEAVNKKINEAIAPYKEMSKYLLGANYDMAQYTVKGMQDRSADLGKDLYYNSPMSKQLQRQSALLATPGGDKLFQSLYGPALMADASTVGIMRRFVTDDFVAGGMQSAIPNENGKPTTVNSMLEHMYRTGAPVPTGAAMAIEQLGKFTDPNIPNDFKQGLVTYYYHPSNMGLLSKFNKEQRGHVFNQMTSDGVLDNVWKATEGRPDLRNQVVDWARHAFAMEFMTTEIKDLNGITMPEGVTVNFDNKTSRFRLMFKGQDVTNSQFIPGVNQRYTTAGQPYTAGFNAVKAPVTRINQAIENVKGIAKRVDQDPNEWLISALQTAGLNIDYSRITADPDTVNKAKGK